MNNIWNFICKHRYDIFFTFVLISLFFFIFVILQKNETKNIIQAIENKTFDIRQKIISKNKKANKDIIIVTVDDPSYEYLVDTYGDWPIPRSVYAEILEYIQSQKPKLVAFDFLFIKSLKRVPESDKKLVDALKKYENTYTAINFDNYSKELRIPPNIDKKLFTNINIESKNIEIPSFLNCRPIMGEIIEATDRIGHINTPKADDGFIRTVPVIINYQKDNEEPKHILYMTLKVAIEYLNNFENENIDIKSLTIDKNNNLILGNKKIPLTQKGEAIINWYGGSGLNNNSAYTYVSFWEILKSIKAKENSEKEILENNLFKDKIVYLGTSVFSLSDIKTVPTSKYMPGVEIHANLLNNIIDNNFIKKAPLIYNVITCIFLAFISFLTVFKIRSVNGSVGIFIILIALYIYLSTLLMEKYNIWLWIVIPLISTTISFISAFIIKYLLKSRDFEYTYKLATTDGLTELYNHRFFQEEMKKKIEECERTENCFSLILIDIDFFKKFNDKYGHQAGDAVLKHVAKTLKNSVRSDDFVCRYGGEEMAIILNNTTKEKSIEIANKICKTIASKKYELTPELEVNVTISLGVSTYPENGKTTTDLIEYSDKCLYKAKENGRNQVGLIE